MSDPVPLFQAPGPAAASAGLSDVLAPCLPVVFCGLNPATSAVRDGHNFSSPSNRFWRVLHLSGFTPYLLRAEQERQILDYGCGITAFVSRATKGAAELGPEDYAFAAPEFKRKIEVFRPRKLAFLGKPAFAGLIKAQSFDWGRQAVTFGGAEVWVLPNPSGLNRSFSLLALVTEYTRLRANYD
ncbi:G/U mismatch-specific DNA glycosylase [Rhizobium leguminosarum]|uniref:G/U mismatch-specific DNA glycosylase n=1 Tax=Rhizobium leguminosarum TaxID=384 RepID=UPI00102FC511|nr:G/U mismatch-specific DNA glycosylase [Rhizobium leguminosarum]QIO76221.1 G/U mismatch-specific DNA glycosylase [Rhizobium leguminosarum bv. trifolii]QIO83239.1 G/U mismatch-specific DNA glycosylase [Rhizobium leguminosarum bv. trifolii]TAX44025.1 G/U mismatch-specific DNA glycosylase [Rhizobium leguminosarum]TAZ49220.1 G/U mismatch-specific DNA glycosylase [Rhizobium leguminosarum]WSH74435.1 G/U mismatch-specific DNA glycosylase [Rhizobium leguminosarum]